MQNPFNTHLKVVKRILRYLAGTQDFGLNMQKPQDLRVVAFANAEWAVDLYDKRAVSKHCIYVGGNLVSWSSKK